MVLNTGPLHYSVKTKLLMYIGLCILFFCHINKMLDLIILNVWLVKTNLQYS